MTGGVTDGVEQWVINLPVWFQTPLVLVVLLPVSYVVTRVILWLVTKVIAPDDEERRFFGRAASGTDAADTADVTSVADVTDVADVTGVAGGTGSTGSKGDR
ncbi:hypothetical protein [Corynebacterium nuruki]|uniref:hypothetical protein n=1 Tax=Corynebacterium nuruki TaxID=1032851 RepID=UPI0039BEDA0E